MKGSLARVAWAWLSGIFRRKIKPVTPPTREPSHHPRYEETLHAESVVVGQSSQPIDGAQPPPSETEHFAPIAEDIIAAMATVPEPAIEKQRDSIQSYDVPETPQLDHFIVPEPHTAEAREPPAGAGTQVSTGNSGFTPSEPSVSPKVIILTDVVSGNSDAGVLENVEATQLSHASPPELYIEAGDMNASPAEQTSTQPLPSATQYRPQLDRTRTQIPKKRTSRPKRPTLEAFDAEFLLAFLPGDWGLMLSALIKRPTSSADTLRVVVAGQVSVISAVDEAMFEPLPISNAKDALDKGYVAVDADGSGRRWTRTGRRLHVFSERSGVSGFSSVPRAVIGQENVVLCRSDYASEVLGQMAAIGASEPRPVEGPGLPDGWLCWRAVFPVQAAEITPSDPLLYALDPLPDAAISLAGGISISRGRWTAGRPPAIHILGSVPKAGEVLIDGLEAHQNSSGAWETSNWDQLGAHLVRYRGLSRTYSIEESSNSWSWWPAHSGSIQLAGTLSGESDPIMIPLKQVDLWLIGQVPGEYYSPSQFDGRAGAMARPMFKPIWAVGRKVGRRRPKPFLIGMPESPKTTATAFPAAAVKIWSRLIREAGRPPDVEGAISVALWGEYLETARTLRKRSR